MPGSELIVREFERENPKHWHQLAEFCERCAELGIQNNSSFKNLKIDDFKDRHFKLWIVIDTQRDKIVGTAGSHHLTELGEKYFRVLFRGCILPEYRGRGMGGLSKNHSNSFIFRYVTPLQIQWAQALGGEHFVVTTNLHAKDGAGSTDRIFHILERQGVVKKIRENLNLFATIQNVWELRADFFSARLEEIVEIEL